jgi:hypothetical protein
VHYSLRRKELCEENLCPDSPGPGLRCPKCPLTKLDVGLNSEVGLVLRNAMNLRSMIKAGITISRKDLNAAELYALLVFEEESAAYEHELAERSK